MKEVIPEALYADRTVRRHIEDARRALNRARAACAGVVRVAKARKQSGMAALNQMMGMLADIKRLAPVITYADPDLQPEGLRHLADAQETLEGVSTGLTQAGRSLRLAADVWGVDPQQQRELRRTREAQEILTAVLRLLEDTGKPTPDRDLEPKKVLRPRTEGAS